MQEPMSDESERPTQEGDAGRQARGYQRPRMMMVMMPAMMIGFLGWHLLLWKRVRRAERRILALERHRNGGGGK